MNPTINPYMTGCGRRATGGLLPGDRRVTGFTLIELLVVIAIIQHSWWIPRSGLPGFSVMSSDRANTNAVDYGWPTRLEDQQSATSPILTDNLYQDGFNTNVASASRNVYGTDHKMNRWS